MNVSPVALFVYKRPQHTQRTLEALRNNVLADRTDLHIYADGPQGDADREAVEVVRAGLTKVKGFQSVKVILHKRNRGLAESVISGVSEVVREHGRVIVVEDDLVTSRFFLKYMNDSLEFYKSDQDVISVHGYFYPIKAQLPETFFLKGADCWGWGTWKRGWDLFEPDGTKLLGELRSKGLEKEFDLGGSYHYTQMLKQQCAGEIDSWAIRWHASAFLKNKLTLYPGRSLVHNIGHDSSGSHSETMDAFDVSLSQSPIQVSDIPKWHNEEIARDIGRYLRLLKPGPMDKMKRRIRNLFLH
ncbi:MAG: glycosyltransferase family 2 protein [Ignavibacteriales bacterium]|nr:glycosyltransferase family 2 protein [Ignavibacteriales bacterium]